MHSDRYSTAKLTAGQKDFLSGLKSDPTMRRWGMEQLIARDDALKFLKPMVDLGFFSPIENPAPIPGPTDGSYRIPRWEVLIYLEKVAKVAQDDSVAVKHIVEILRDVTRHTNDDNAPTDNYSTWHSFAKVLSALPVDSYSTDELRMLRVWLQSKFERGGLIGVVLSQELLPKLLDSGARDKIVVVVEEITRLTWTPTDTSTSGSKAQAVTAVDPYWLAKLFDRHGKAVGEKCSPEVQRILADRVRELYERSDEDTYSWILRPAIEKHPTQSGDPRETQSVLVDALRDTLIAFVDGSPSEARSFIEDLLEADLDILRRIGIHVVDERYESLPGVLRSNLNKQLKLTLIHEVYRLLQRNFGAMNEEEQKQVVVAIQSITLGPEKAEDTKRFQGRLAHAIFGKGSVEADRLHEDLKQTADWDKEDMHPDFLSYMTSWSGPGPTPYSVEQLRLLNDDELVDTLNQYEEQKGWHSPRTPTIKALCESVTQLAKEEPGRFLELLPHLCKFNPPYQYAILDAFRGLSHGGTPNDQGLNFPWNRFWNSFLSYVRAAMHEGILLPESNVGEVPSTFTPSRRWLLPVIADIIRNGTHDDHRAIPIPQISAVLGILEYVLGVEPSTAEGSDSDAMTEAINTVKGHWIEALVQFSLYICRNGDREKTKHSDEWQAVQPLFDREIAASRSGNYEFSTLCGAYLANLYFMSPEWVTVHISEIFPGEDEYRRNFDCAVQGLAYMPQPTRKIYQLLRSRGILHTALNRTSKGRHAREKVLQHICVGYLWGDEALEEEDGLFHLVLARFAPSDIHEVVRFFWGIQGDQLTRLEVDKIISFWRACMEHVDEQKDGHKKILSDLGLLTAFLKRISAEHLLWLLRIAPYIGANHNTDFFVEYLERLTDISPGEVAKVILSVVSAERPYYDFEDRYQSIIRKLLATDHWRDALELCNRPGLMELESIAAIYAEHRDRQSPSLGN